MKKIISLFLSLSIIFLSMSCAMGITHVAYADTVSDELVTEKNLPLPSGYGIDMLMSFDTDDDCRGTLSTEEGTYFDTASNAETLTGYWSEHRMFTEYVPLIGKGFMFWYKSEAACVLRLRTQNNGLVMEANLPSCPDGQWITYYYFGTCINFTFKTDMSSDIRTVIANTDNRYMLNIISVSGNVIYIDEFFTFSPKITPADTYDNDEQAFKFSLNRYEKSSKTVAEYSDDGSVTLSSQYGSTTNNSPVNIYYNMDVEQLGKAIEIAKQGSGYLQIQVENLSCLNSSDEEAYACINLKIGGIEKKLIKYHYGSGTTEAFLIKVDDVESVDAVTTLFVGITGSNIKDVKFKFSPITVFHFPDDEIIMQAEDLSPKHYTSSGTTEDAPISTDSDGNRTYVYSNTNDSWISFQLPELTVGEYEVYANCNAIVNTNVKVNVSINNLRQLTDVVFADETYSSQRHNINIPIGNLKITKSYSDGASVLKFSSIQYCSAQIFVDYFSFKKTDTAVEAEPSSNFVIKDYPEMENYEIKTILNTYDTYICGSYERWYKTQQIAGYVGDGNAFNLNSRATIGGGFDNNIIWNNKSSGLDGNGLRFWYKCSAKAWLRFYNGNMSERFSAELPINTDGGWYTIYYSDLLDDGDMSSYYNIELLGGGDSYIDEFHTIWEKEGDLTYELNGDGTASVVGYNLRLEDVTVAETYQGCPVVSIEDGALSGSLTLKSVTLPSSVTMIGEGAFDGCLNLKTINLENVTTIVDAAFNDCEKMTNVTLNDDTANISATAFTGCDTLYINVTNNSNQKSYAISNSIDYKCETEEALQYYRDYADDDSTVNIIGYSGAEADLTVPATIDGANVVMIDSGAFSGNSVIKNVVLPSTVTTIKSEAFNACVNLKSIQMKGVLTISEKAFYDCTALDTATVGDTLTTIDTNAFANCSALKEFYFGDSITSIGDNAFKNVAPIAVLTDATYSAKTGYSYTYVNDNELKYYPGNDATFEYYVVNYVASISGYKSSSITVEIPSNIDGYDVKNVAENTFKGNSYITTVKFNENMRNINDYAFYDCAKLASVTYPESLRKITEYAFASCPSLLSVSLTNVVVIADTAFDDTTAINIVQTNFMRDALDYVNGITAGWNLGNTLDAHSHKYSYGDLTVSQSEQLWRGWNYISQDLFDLVVENFNTIRIPITWNAFINPDDNYNIDKEFMDRIQEVVDMCYKAGFKYIIINTHHDSDYYFNVNPENDLEEGKVVIGRVWEQISERFADYDEKLIFESMNEIRSFEMDWSSADWNGNDELYENYNNLNKIFYETVRSSSGNNAERYLLLQTYGGMRDGKHIGSLWLPDKETDDHIIASIHWYNETVTEAYWTGILNMCKKQWIDNGIPCIVGETGLPTYYDSEGNITVYDDDYREKWGTFAFGLFEQYGLKAIIWEDHGTYSTVNYNSTDGYYWKFPKYVAAITEATKKSDTDTDTGTTVGYSVTIDGTEYSKVTSGASITLPENTDYGFVAYTDGTNYYTPGDSLTISANVSLTSVSLAFEMMAGTSFRYNSPSGLRFYSKVDTDLIDALRAAGATIELGTLISQRVIIGDQDFTKELDGLYLDVKYTSKKWFNNNGFKGLVGSIVNVKEGNTNAQFVGRGYITIKFGSIEKTIYAEYANSDISNNSRSIGYVANKIMLNDYNDLSDDQKVIVKFYADLYDGNDKYSNNDPYNTDKW